MLFEFLIIWCSEKLRFYLILMFLHYYNTYLNIHYYTCKAYRQRSTQFNENHYKIPENNAFFDMQNKTSVSHS